MVGFKNLLELMGIWLGYPSMKSFRITTVEVQEYMTIQHTVQEHMKLSLMLKEYIKIDSDIQKYIKIKSQVE